MSPSYFPMFHSSCSILNISIKMIIVLSMKAQTHAVTAINFSLELYKKYFSILSISDSNNFTIFVKLYFFARGIYRFFTSRIYLLYFSGFFKTVGSIMQLMFAILSTIFTITADLFSDNLPR